MSVYFLNGAVCVGVWGRGLSLLTENIWNTKMLFYSRKGNGRPIKIYYLKSENMESLVVVFRYGS